MDAPQTEPRCNHCQKLVEDCDCPDAVVSPEQWLLRVMLYPERFGNPLHV